MASGNGSHRQRQGPPSADGYNMQSGFNSPGGSQYRGPNPQRFPSHQDSQRPLNRYQQQEIKQWKAMYNSEGRPLARDLFGGPLDSNSSGPDAPRTDNSYYGPQYAQGSHHHHGNHSGQKYHGNRQQGQSSQASNNPARNQKSQTSHHPDSSRQSSKTKSHPKENQGEKSAEPTSQRSSVKQIDENLNESSKKSKKDSISSQTPERKVLYLEDPLESEFHNLKITVIEKAKPKKTSKSAKKIGKGEVSNKTAESSVKKVEAQTKNAVSSLKPTPSPIKQSVSSNERIEDGVTHAEKFVNPLLSRNSEGKDSPSVKGLSSHSRSGPSDSGSQTTPTQSDAKPEKKKKKKKKKKKSHSNEVSALVESIDSSGPASRVPETPENTATSTDKTSVTTTDEVVTSTPNPVKTDKEDGSCSDNKVTPSDQKDTQAFLEKGLEQAEERLQKDFIYKLEKKSPKHPNAIYFCRVCSHHIDSIAVAHKHIKDKRHKREAKAKQNKEALINYEMPPPAALDALSRHLEDVISEEMLTDDGTRERQKVVRKLNEFIDAKVEGCQLVMFGSSVTMIGMKDAEINIEIQYSGDMKIPSLLLKLLGLLRECDFLADVHEDFEARVPTITATDREMNFVCVLSVHNSKSVQSTRLIKLYAALDSKVLQLAKIFRLWGRCCNLDNQQLGSLPSHAYALLAIFYLQQEQQLPVLHEVMAEHDIESVLLEGCGFEEILKIVDGEWWYYPTAPPIGEETKKAEVEIEEPEDTIDLAESDCDLEITFEASLEIEKKDRPLIPTKLSRCYDSHAPTIGELWIKMLKFFAAKQDTENVITTIRCLKKVTRAERNWPHRRLALEDPTSPKHNLLKTVTSQGMFTFYQAQLCTSIIYFLTAHKKYEMRGKSAFNHSEENKRSETESSDHDNESAEIAKVIGQVLDDVINDVASKEEENGQKKEINYDGCYQFVKKFLTDGQPPVTICRTCKREGHSKKDCPDEVTIEIKSLPEFTDEMKRKVDAVTMDCYNVYAPKENEVSTRNLVCQDILDFLRKNYDDNVNLRLFGSSRNGFTFRESDLDICLTFSGNETGEGLDFTEIIEELAKTLRKDTYLRQIIPITTAKVPIVKFYVPRAAIEGDISLYNLLAQRNTTMLALYSSIDERCKFLGYAMKAFVKQCGIGDASRGSLSSYAYTLLVIYFLQQRNPPVLPVLQELYDGEKCPELIVDGWNAWFYDDIKNLDKVWPEFGKNEESVGELWLGMLRFYTEEFDFPRHVVAIKQKKLLTAFEKEWTSKFICIEDPFDLSHNLGSAISRKMAKFINKTFIRARERFGMPPGNEIDKYKWMDYYFDVKFLTDGQEVPNDRCCRICGRIGHFVKDCPRRRNKKNQADSKMRDQQCFNCGLKGHYRSNCPLSKKGARDGPVVQVHPLMMNSPQLRRPNSRQGSPGKPQRRQDGRHEPTQDSETTWKRHSTRERTPTNNVQPPSRNRSPFPSGSPQSTGRRNQHQSYNRSLSDFEYENRWFENSPRPLSFDPNQGQQKRTAKHYSLGDSPSPGKMLTVKDIEEKLRDVARQHRSNGQMIPTPSQQHPTAKHYSFGDSPSSGKRFTVKKIEEKLREDARQQRSNEQMIPTPSQRHPTFHVRPPHPRIQMQHSVPPMTSTPPRHPAQFMPPFQTQRQTNTFVPPREFSPHGADISGRTPPSPMTAFFPSPRHIHHPQQPGPPRHHHPNDGPGFNINPPEPIQSRTFASGSNEPLREVHFTNPGSPGYHSYPPGPGQPPNWNRRNM